MMEIDFLPQSFHEAARRRQRNRRNLLYSLALVTGLAVLSGLTRSEIRSAEAVLQTVREGAGLRGAHRVRLTALEQVRHALQQKADLLSRFEDDAPIDGVIGEITRLMSPGMALRSLSLRPTDDPAPAGLPAGNSEVNAAPGYSVNGLMQVVLQGVAPNDVEVGTFFGRLSTCPLLEAVRLSYSREEQQAGRSVRAFELRFTIRRVTLEASGTESRASLHTAPAARGLDRAEPAGADRLAEVPAK